MRGYVQGKRYLLPNTRVMLHHPSGTARGQATDIHNEARELMRLRNYVNNVLATATGQPLPKARPWLGTCITAWPHWHLGPVNRPCQLKKLDLMSYSWEAP